MNKIQQLYKATFRFIALHFFLTFFHIINSIIWLSHIKKQVGEIFIYPLLIEKDKINYFFIFRKVNYSR